MLNNYFKSAFKYLFRNKFFTAINFAGLAISHCLFLHRIVCKLHVASNNLPNNISNIERAYKKLAPGLPFTYSFADEAYNAQYMKQEHFGKLFICFAVIAIFISCLGLFGLSVFTISQKEHL